LRLKELERIVHGTAAAGVNGDLTFRGVSIDSRTTREGNLFIPLTRIKDGHDYAHEAIRNGAAAMLWQSDHPDPPTDVPVIAVEDCLAALQTLAGDYRSRLPVKVVGITGSNGKTTTKDMIDSILSVSYKVHKTKGNLNSQIGLPLTLLDIAPDTEYAVIEMGMSERGQIERLSKLAKPDIAVITMIGVSHLSSLGSREQIAAAKMEIVLGMKEGGALVYNGGEPLLADAEKAAACRAVRTVRFGTPDSFGYCAKSIRSDASGVSFQVGGNEYRIPLLGKHNVTNALASIAVAAIAGITSEQCRAGLSKLTVTGMRMEVSRSSAGYTVINDAWNASPVSVQAAIETFAELEGYSNKFLVLGDMRELGPEERAYHKEIGRRVDPGTIQYVFTIGELAREIALEAAGRFPTGNVKAFEHKDQIIGELRAVIAPTDAVLIKGSRGLELEHIAFGLM
jgi:UDP-N-acetylmuramoyl-tripeptide--D-alanyl-D-alanine ligase